VKRAEPVFAASPSGELVEISISEVGIEHPVKVFVRKIRKGLPLSKPS
jgi:hypothetical protein